jgi:hypothetical protein
VRLKACLPEWLADDEADHRRLEADVRQSLLSASRATLDRLLIPARIAHRRRATTRPGSLWRGEIPLRTDWAEAAPGYLELDTVALDGGCLDDRHGWMLDAGTPACRQAGPHHLERLARPAQSQRSQCLQAFGRPPRPAALPAARAGQRPVCRQAGNGGEFINHQLGRY